VTVNDLRALAPDDGHQVAHYQRIRQRRRVRPFAVAVKALEALDSAADSVHPHFPVQLVNWLVSRLQRRDRYLVPAAAQLGAHRLHHAFLAPDHGREELGDHQDAHAASSITVR